MEQWSSSVLHKHDNVPFIEMSDNDERKKSAMSGNSNKSDGHGDHNYDGDDGDDNDDDDVNSKNVRVKRYPPHNYLNIIRKIGKLLERTTVIVLSGYFSLIVMICLVASITGLTALLRGRNSEKLNTAAPGVSLDVSSLLEAEGGEASPESDEIAVTSLKIEESTTTTALARLLSELLSLTVYILGGKMATLKFLRQLLRICVSFWLIFRPILSTCSVCFGFDMKSSSALSSQSSSAVHPMIAQGKNNGNLRERIIAIAFLLSIVCNQLPKRLSAFVAACAVLAFGLASRQLQDKNDYGRKINPKEESQPDAKPELNIRSRLTLRGGFGSVWSRLTINERASLGTLAVVASLLFENFLIWVVSATYAPGIHGFPEPLQDNGRAVLQYLSMELLGLGGMKHFRGITIKTEDDIKWVNSLTKKALQKIRDTLNVQWALVAALGGAFVCLELRLGDDTARSLYDVTTCSDDATAFSHNSPIRTSNGIRNTSKLDQITNNLTTRLIHHRTLGGFALHALLTLSSARVIRTLSFILTVLPSQQRQCYIRHFPYPPPADWGEWLMVGFLPNSRGGCNDLILSGHATVTATLACSATSVAGGSDAFNVAVWTLLIVDYAIEAYQGLHYSVDMWLGGIVTCLLWQLTKPVESMGLMERERIARSIAVDRLQSNLASDSKTEDKGYNRNPRKGHIYDNRATPLNPPIIALYALPAFLGYAILTVIPEAIANYFLVGYTLWATIILGTQGQTNFSQHVLICLLYATLGTYL